VEGHRHQPEIEQELGNFAGAAVKIVFQTHLVPMTRGIFVTIYVKLKKNISEEEGRAIYRKYFGGEKFVRLLPAGVWPATKNVSGSNYFDLNFKLYPTTGQLVILGVLDNLVKGASGQAVQNMNLVMGFEESLGLEQTPIFP
jgi:N-acetyl-gamma-glutamyl-phosphate reductase